MGWLKILLGANGSPIGDPVQLKSALQSTFESGDAKWLERLCRVNREQIKEHFGSWQAVPDDFCCDQEAIQRHMNFVMSVAQTFEARLRDDSLVQRLNETPKTNPLTKWLRDLEAAQAMMARLEFRPARDLLAKRLPRLGNGKGHYYSILTHGLLGQCYFDGGEMEQAPSHFEAALELCRKDRNADGVEVYLENLFETYRYLDQPDRASACADELGELLDLMGKTAKSARFLRRAEIVRGGEPLNRVVGWFDGLTFEMDDFAATVESQNLQLIFERNRVTLRPALRFIDQGKMAASEGRYEDALNYFEQAAVTDRYDPDCHFQAGHAYLHLQRYWEAMDAFTKTEELAPGWHSCRADRWMAERLLKGDLHHEHFLGSIAVEDYTIAVNERLRLAESLLQQVPDFAVISIPKSYALRQLSRLSEAVSTLRQGLAHADEPDVRTRLLVELGVLVDPVEGRDLLQQAVELKGNLLSAAYAKLALQQL